MKILLFPWFNRHFSNSVEEISVKLRETVLFAPYAEDDESHPKLLESPQVKSKLFLPFVIKVVEILKDDCFSSGCLLEKFGNILWQVQVETDFFVFGSISHARLNLSVCASFPATEQRDQGLYLRSDRKT